MGFAPVPQFRRTLSKCGRIRPVLIAAFIRAQHQPVPARSKSHPAFAQARKRAMGPRNRIRPGSVQP